MSRFFKIMKPKTSIDYIGIFLIVWTFLSLLFFGVPSESLLVRIITFPITVIRFYLMPVPADLGGLLVLIVNFIIFITIINITTIVLNKLIFRKFSISIILWTITLLFTQILVSSVGYIAETQKHTQRISIKKLDVDKTNINIENCLIKERMRKNKKAFKVLVCDIEVYNLSQNFVNKDNSLHEPPVYSIYVSSNGVHVSYTTISLKSKPNNTSIKGSISLTIPENIDSESLYISRFVIDDGFDSVVSPRKQYLYK